jgi:hypothetical protein
VGLEEKGLLGKLGKEDLNALLKLEEIGALEFSQVLAKLGAIVANS